MRKFSMFFIFVIFFNLGSVSAMEREESGANGVAPEGVISFTSLIVILNVLVPHLWWGNQLGYIEEPFHSEDAILSSPQITDTPAEILAENLLAMLWIDDESFSLEEMAVMFYRCQLPSLLANDLRSRLAQIWPYSSGSSPLASNLNYLLFKQELRRLLNVVKFNKILFDFLCVYSFRVVQNRDLPRYNREPLTADFSSWLHSHNPDSLHVDILYLYNYRHFPPEKEIKILKKLIAAGYEGVLSFRLKELTGKR